MSNDHLKYDLGPDSMPINAPRDVLQLLSDEIEERWGTKGSRGLPMRLTSKLKGQIDKTLIQIHSPEVIRDMIRLLIWDWEVAREDCFPFRKGVPFPDPLALVQYAKELATRIGTGFVRGTAHRGAHNSYRNLFIEKSERDDDEDPY